MDLRQFFGAVFCVNLQRRPDRWQQFVANVPADWPFAAITHSQAIDGKRVPPPTWWKQGAGAWGCYRSHMSLIEHCLNHGIESVLLLEDDALFPDDFVSRVSEFLRHVPDDWGMLYLGGQHLKKNVQPPEEINQHVWRPFNVNRTHAFALRGATMKAVYKHLHAQDWRNGHHIDHHLGRFHQLRSHPIYCPREWLVGQAAGKSNISGKTPPDRFWMAASTAAVKPVDNRFVAVLGLHSSGSSCVAGVLYHLGLHLGNKLSGYYGSNPDQSCGFEAAGLASLCEAAIPFPAVELKQKRGKVFSRLQKWIKDRQREAHAKGTLAAGKYPMLCRLGTQLRNIAGADLRVISIERPLQDSIDSLIKRCPKKPPEALDAHQRWLHIGREQTMDALADNQKLRVEYYRLLADPDGEIRRICEFLDITPTAEQLAKAALYVQPDKQHIGDAADVA